MDDGGQGSLCEPVKLLIKRLTEADAAPAIDLLHVLGQQPPLLHTTRAIGSNSTDHFDLLHVLGQQQPPLLHTPQQSLGSY